MGTNRDFCGAVELRARARKNENPLDERALYEALYGTRAHDLLHGKQYGDPSFPALMRVSRADGCRGLPSITGDSDSLWTVRWTAGARERLRVHTVARRSEANAGSVSDVALASRRKREWGYVDVIRSERSSRLDPPRASVRARAGGSRPPGHSSRPVLVRTCLAVSRRAPASDN
jgi:hypothetical protein